MKIKGILFDLDNTLYDEIDYFKAVLSQFSKKYQIDISKGLAWLSHENRLKSSDILRDILIANDSYERVLHERLFSLYAKAEITLSLESRVKKLLRMLRKNGIKTALLTNGVVAVQKNKVKALGLSCYVEKVVYARENGMVYEKPHVSAFHRCSKVLGMSPAECMMIGDSLTNDINGALAAGMSAIHYRCDSITELVVKTHHPHAISARSFEHLGQLLREVL